jgi:glucosamine--fructose-6-phosphate aminotransferase (isomerizing)
VLTAEKDKAMPDSNMSAEIREQPEILRRLIEEGWDEILLVARALRERRLRSVMIAARGTSDNAALYAKYLFEVNLDVPTALASPSTFTLYEGNMALDDVLVIGISQSGESKDILETVRRSRALGATTLTVTNNASSSMAQATEHHFSLRAGKEESVAATKTYTAQLLVLYLLVAALRGERLGDEVRRLPEQVREALDVEWEGTERYRYAEYLVATSRGYNLPTAQEAALKLMETSYVVAQAFSAADLRHGPIAMIGSDFPVVAIVPLGKVQEDLRSLVNSLHNRGAELIAISNDRSVLEKASAKFEVPVQCPEELSPILYAAPIQLFAENLARLKNLNPDNPRGLSKVTETW